MKDETFNFRTQTQIAKANLDAIFCVAELSDIVLLNKMIQKERDLFVQNVELNDGSEEERQTGRKEKQSGSHLHARHPSKRRM